MCTLPTTHVIRTIKPSHKTFYLFSTFSFTRCFSFLFFMIFKNYSKLSRFFINQVQKKYTVWSVRIWISNPDYAKRRCTVATLGGALSQNYVGSALLQKQCNVAKFLAVVHCCKIRRCTVAKLGAVYCYKIILCTVVKLFDAQLHDYSMHCCKIRWSTVAKLIGVLLQN